MQQNPQNAIIPIPLQDSRGVWGGSASRFRPKGMKTKSCVFFSFGGCRFDITSLSSLRHCVFVLRRVTLLSCLKWQHLKKNGARFSDELLAHCCGILHVHAQRGPPLMAAVTKTNGFQLHVRSVRQPIKIVFFLTVDM